MSDPARESDQLLESKRVQLGLLQKRISLHGSRMWQYPLTYLGTIAITLNGVLNKKTSLPLHMLFLSLSLLGFIFLYCHSGAFEGYRRTARNMQNLEEELGLKNCTQCPLSHWFPYVLLIIFGIMATIAFSIYYWP